jgi:CRP/FNR family transcriptional regulator, cyclic AMP receptor protein
METHQAAVEPAVRPDGSFENILADLPLAAYAAGEAVLTAGSKTARLYILKTGAVVVRKDGIELARVAEPGTVFGELSALLEIPHTADVRAVED